MSTGFAGGIGGTTLENCGAFSAGVMIIGGLHGRTAVDADDQKCQDLVAAYRERFLDRFGTTNCSKLRDGGYGSGGEEPCATLVERACRILLAVIREERT
jgi:C_GCAxxG_C_C family probable redox protein